MLLVLAAALAVSSPPARAQGANPLAGVRLFVDHDSPSWHQWRAYRRAGKRHQAALVWKIAREPKALWLGRFTRPHFNHKVRRLIQAARHQGSVPVFTVMRAESRGCGPGYTGGGSAEDASTRAWYRRLARAIGYARVVIAFEPDSLGTIDCHARSRRDDRIRLLRYGVSTLSRLPGTTIYLEAGASDWEPARRTARQLRAIGIAKVRGFMLNATHFDWTRNNIRHGLEISRRRGRQALHRQHRRERPRSDPLSARERAADQRVVQPEPARARHPADHEHLQSDGRRLPLDQPPRLRPGLSGPADRLVRVPGAELRALRDPLGEPTPRHKARISSALEQHFGRVGRFPWANGQEKRPTHKRCGTIDPMRPATALTAAVIAALATTAAIATAAPGDPKITADPVRVHSNAVQTVRGRNWPVIEFCSRTVRVSVQSAQNSAPIAQRHVSDTGRFRFRWSPQNKNIGPGRWRLVARMRCESGKDGSINIVKASTLIRVLP